MVQTSKCESAVSADALMFARKFQFESVDDRARYRHRNNDVINECIQKWIMTLFML